MTRVIAVLGYGCHLTPDLETYLGKVVDFVAYSPGDPVIKIIVSGGYTNLKTKAGVSEAEMMQEALATRLEQRGIAHLIIIKDEEPIDTRGNLRGIERILKEEQLEHLPLVIFCDGVHAPKIRLFSLFLHHSWPRIETHSLTKGLVPKLNHLFVVTALEMSALLIPYMERKRVARRQGIIANS